MSSLSSLKPAGLGPIGALVGCILGVILARYLLGVLNPYATEKVLIALGGSVWIIMSLVINVAIMVSCAISGHVLMKKLSCRCNWSPKS